MIRSEPGTDEPPAADYTAVVRAEVALIAVPAAVPPLGPQGSERRKCLEAGEMTLGKGARIGLRLDFRASFLDLRVCAAVE
jgi:hypothetical protein